MGKPLNASDVPLQDEYFSWNINNQQWLLTADGTLTTTVNNIKKKIKLPLSRYIFPISQVSYFNTPDTLFLLYDTELAGDSAAFICSIKKYPLKKKWCQDVNTFNLSATMSDRTIWIGGLGFVARLNSKDGKYIWQKQVYETYHFDKASFFDETESTVTFVTEAYGKNKKKLLLDRSAGKILSFN